jgi:hypothetical protein
MQELHSYHGVPPAHAQDEGTLTATLIQARFFECSPADGMSAATEFGTSACPVGSSVIRLPRIHSLAKEGNVGSWPMLSKKWLEIGDEQ